MLVFTLVWTKVATQLLLDQAFAPSGPRLAIALQAKNAPGQLVTPLKTEVGTKPGGPMMKKAKPMPVQKAKEKARKARKARPGLLLRKVTSSSAEDPLSKKMTGLLHLRPGSEASPLLAKPTGLPALDGLEALALTKIVGIGIPLLAETSRQETARKEANANSCTILTRSKQPFRKPKLVYDALASLRLSLLMICLS